MSELNEVLEHLDELKEDNTISKNVRDKISEVIKILNEDEPIELRVNKAMQNLDDLSEDISIHSYTRTQIWNIVSLLETLNE